MSKLCSAWHLNQIWRLTMVIWNNIICLNMVKPVIKSFRGYFFINVLNISISSFKNNLGSIKNSTYFKDFEEFLYNQKIYQLHLIQSHIFWVFITLCKKFEHSFPFTYKKLSSSHSLLGGLIILILFSVKDTHFLRCDIFLSNSFFERLVISENT